MGRAGPLLAEMRPLLADMLHTVMPRRCASCGTPLHVMEQHWCCLCAFMWVRITHASTSRFDGRMDWAFGWSWLSMAQPFVRPLVHAMKYNGNPQLGAALGSAMAEEWVAGKNHISALPLDRWKVVPVPLHKRRKRKRGFNQSLQLALGWCKVTGMEIAPVLVRTHSDRSFTRFNRNERIARHRSRFAWDQTLPPPRAEVSGLIIMDDVVTTGSTLESLHHTLRRHWSGPLAYVTLADAGH
jgi:predicted amidophosphoribosyltransferase